MSDRSADLYRELRRNHSREAVLEFFAELEAEREAATHTTAGDGRARAIDPDVFPRPRPSDPSA